jgi:GalNAc5-diNAcBac-PP-undecaprenol beta-1,3-glucosyltransferase
MRASVVIPTHEHATTLPYSVASVQSQAIDDVEILIVGDGVTEAVRATVNQLQATDPRIRFFEFPKGERNGERHRDVVLRQARGRNVFYQADDDLWLPGHLRAMEEALEHADFVGAMHVNVETDGRVQGFYFDLEREEFTTPWLAWRQDLIHRHGSWAMDGFGLAFCAHRLDAYLRLPEVWSPAPPGWQSDQFMWKKFVRQPWCKVKFLAWPVSLHFSAPHRRDWSPQQRADELARWSQFVAEPDGVIRIYRTVLADLGHRLLDDSAMVGRERQVHSERERELKSALEALVHTTGHRDALLASTSWRLTSPIRAGIRALQRLKARLGAARR